MIKRATLTAITAAAACDPRVRPKTLQVLCVLAGHADYQTREAHPSVSTLAAMLGNDRRTVQRALRRAEELGYVSRATQFRASKRKGEYAGGYSSNLYSLHLPKNAPKPDNDAAHARRIVKADEAANRCRIDEVAQGAASSPVDDAAPRCRVGGGAYVPPGGRYTAPPVDSDRISDRLSVLNLPAGRVAGVASNPESSNQESDPPALAAARARATSDPEDSKDDPSERDPCNATRLNGTAAQLSLRQLHDDERAVARQGAWFNRACQEVRRVLPSHAADTLIAGALDGNADAKARIEQLWRARPGARAE